MLEDGERVKEDIFKRSNRTKRLPSMGIIRGGHVGDVQRVERGDEEGDERRYERN